MIDRHEVKDPAYKENHLYHRGQHVFYKGEEAQVLEIKPVFTIRIQGKSHVICGNIYKDIRPSDN